jgi:2-haloacid dehalogenase
VGSVLVVKRHRCPRARRRLGVKTAVFDLGGVIVLWDPVPAVAAAVGQERAERFVHGEDFDFGAWNHAQDAGRSWADAEAAATASHPDLAEEIAAYRTNFALSLRGLVSGTAEILHSLHDRGVRLVALTNWSAETIHHGLEAYPEVFALFDDLVVSGAERVAKPDLGIFQVLARRLGQPIEGVFYVDDSARNVEAALAAGMDAVHFTDATTLLGELRRRALLD